VYGYFYITLAMIAFYFIRQIDQLLLYINSEYVFASLFNENSLQDIEILKSTLGAKILFSIFASIWVCDSAAYFTGKSFGKHKFAEKVSPKKTWEGAIGGLIGALIVGLLFYYFDSFSKSYIYIIIALISGTIGQYGDLVESLIKRDVGVKDSSNLIPGHGGVLDRIDSLLAVSPFVLFILVIFL
jgi:phosphatidate cytidylyltransferase